MGKNLDCLLLFGLIISSIFTGVLFIFSKNVYSAPNSISYTFNDNSFFYFNNNTEYINNITDTQNIRYRTGKFSDIFNATYTFSNYSQGSLPYGFTDDSGLSNCYIGVNNSIYGHNKILRVYDYSGTYLASTTNTWDTNHLTGIIDLWVLFTDDTKRFLIVLWESATPLIRLQTYTTGYFGYWDTSFHNLFNSQNNVWYHFSIRWDATNNFDLYVNGYKYDIPTFNGNSQTLGCNAINFYTHASDSNYIAYIDAIGYNWDSYYTIDDNVIPVMTFYNETQSNRYEFSMYALNSQNDIGLDNPNTWDDIEIASEDEVNIYYDILNQNDRNVKIRTGWYAGTCGIKKDDFNIDTYRVNLTFGFNITDLDNTNGKIQMKAKSNDSTDIIDLRIIRTGVNLGTLAYYDGASYITIETDITENIFYEFNLYIDFYNSLCVARYFLNGIYDSTFKFPLLSSNKVGISEVSFTCTPTSVLAYNLVVLLDYIGIYSDGKPYSQDREYGFITHDLKDNWNFEIYNLFESISYGLYTLSVCNDSYIVESDFFETIDTGSHDGSIIKNDLYDSINIITPYLVLSLKGNLTIDYIKVYGISLNDGTNDYTLLFSKSEQVLNDDYEYWISNHKLYFTLTYDDDYLEYIQFEFNINNILSINRTLSFYSQYSGVGAPFFRVNYTDETSSVFPFSGYPSTQNNLLASGKNIDTFLIIISDDNLQNNDEINGFISNIELIYYPDLTISYTLFTLTNILIVLIVLIVPTIAISSVFRKTDYKNKVIVPILALMTLICLIIGLIPLWLFFIMLIPLLGFMFLQNRGKR